MNYLATWRAPATAERPSPSDGGWMTMEDAARGVRRLRLDDLGRPAEWVDAGDTRLAFTHDDDGSLRRIASGDWFVGIEGPGPWATFSVHDPAGTTAMRIARDGRHRALRRGADTLAIELDGDGRISRVALPGSRAPLAYDWQESGDCAIAAEGGETLLTLCGAEGARRVRLDAATWWDEAPGVDAVFLTMVADGARDALTIRLDDRFAVTERRWSDGSGDRFERDGERRLTGWIERAADGTERRHAWHFAGNRLVRDPAGDRDVDAAGRVIAAADRTRYRYDAAGRRIARTGPDGESRYRYDPLGTLAAVETPDGGLTRIETDGTGRRVAVRRDGAADRIEHRDEAGRLWAVTAADGAPVHVYIWVGDRIVGRIDGGTADALAEAYVADPFGTPMAAFVRAGEGWAIERLSAPPYGHVADAARPTLYGHFADPVTGLIHFGARDLDPALGVFLTPDSWHGGGDDPRRWAGADDAALRRLHEWPVAGFDDYALCRFDPLGRVDRDGHFAWGDVFLNLFRYVLMATWGFPLTSVSLFFFQPLNLYMELVGLIVWGFKKAFCDDTSHPWGNHTIVKSTWLLGSSRQATFAFGLNGFLPRVVSGQSLSADRAVTVGNVIWINREELADLRRAEVLEVDDLAGLAGAAGVAKFNDDPAKQSVVAVTAPGEGGERLHISAWTRGHGNAVQTVGSLQQFIDRGEGGAPARSTLHLRRRLPGDFPTQGLAVQEYLHLPGVDADAQLETIPQVNFALRGTASTGFAAGDWLRITVPGATPAVPAALMRVREALPAADHTALVLTGPLPAAFATHLGGGMRIEGVRPRTGASAGWTADAPATTLSRTIAAGAAALADFPPDLSRDGLARVVAATPASPPSPAPGVPVEPPQGTIFTRITALRGTMTLVPDAGGAAAGTTLRLQRPSGPQMSGRAGADPAVVTLATPHPEIAADTLLIVQASGGPAFYARAAAVVGGDHRLTLDPPLPAALTAVDLSLQAVSDTADDPVTVTSVAGADVVADLVHALSLRPGNLVRLEGGGGPVLRRIAALGTMEIGLADVAVGSGPFTITPAETVPDRVQKNVRTAPADRFLIHRGGAPLTGFGNWPDTLGALMFEFLGAAYDAAALDHALFVLQPATGPAAGRGWSALSLGGSQFMVLDRPLPILVPTGKSKHVWRADVDDHGGEGDLGFEPVPSPLRMRLRAFRRAGGAQRPAGGGPVLAHEPELLVPEHPRVHDTHERGLIEHEIHHTVQCNFWGPFMTALPVQGVVTQVTDVVNAAGGQTPDWLKPVGDLSLNAFQLFSIGGMMTLAWRYILLTPFRPALQAEIDDLDFDSFDTVFNPVSRLITDALPATIDPNAAAGDRWLAFLGKLFANALDLRSWTAFLGFVPTLLPDGDQNFIEQGASRASGDLYSTIVTANDRWNSRTRVRLKGFHTHREADLKTGVGGIVRLLTFAHRRNDRILAPHAADVPEATITYRDGLSEHPPFTIRPTGVGTTVQFPAELFRMARTKVPSRVVRQVAIDGVAVGGAPAAQQQFFEAEEGDIVVPRPRAMVPMPPRVNRSLGFYLLTNGPGVLEVAGHRPLAENARVTLTGTVAVGDTVRVEASAPALLPAPVPVTTVGAIATDTLQTIASAIVDLINAATDLQRVGIRAVREDATAVIHAPRASEIPVSWTVTPTGTLGVTLTERLAEESDPLTETVTITVADEVRLDDEALGWSPPSVVGQPPAAGTTVRRYETEECVLEHRTPQDHRGPPFVNAGTDGLMVDVPAGAGMVATVKADRSGWTLAMPKVGGPPAPNAPVNLRLLRMVAKDDSAFDLAFADVPTLKGVRSYLEDPVFVVVREFQLTVEALPVLPLDGSTATTGYATAYELKLPIRVTDAGSILVVPPPGAAAPPVARVGDDGRGEIWRIGPLTEPPGADLTFTVTITFGQPGRTVDRSFALTVTSDLQIAGPDALTPGTAAEFDVSGGVPPYAVVAEPALPGLTVEQTSPGKLRVLALGAPEAATEVRLRLTDATQPTALKGSRTLSLVAMPPLLPPSAGEDYFELVRPATRGLAIPLIHGRSSGGPEPDVDLTEPLDVMEAAVKACGPGDAVYLSAWLFHGWTPLTAGGLPGVQTWADLFRHKAAEGVTIRILMTDFDPISGQDQSLQIGGVEPLDTVIAELPENARDRLKYVVSMHPAHVGALKASLAALINPKLEARDIFIASHHQKFMVVRRGGALAAFCGGLDIESRKSPTLWSYTGGLIGWHDLHLQLEGPITRDLERVFIERWNRERDASTRAPQPGWAAMEALAPTPLTPAEQAEAKTPHLLQALRTASDDGGLGRPFVTKRADIAEVYRRAILGATRYLYLENQYFRAPALADWIIASATAHPELRVIMVVVAFAETDDGDNAGTRHGNALQFETLDRIAAALGNRVAFFTMAGRVVHSKMVLVDDEWAMVGSANANPRSFELDTELNVQIADAAFATGLRRRLWAHNLGASEDEIGSWPEAEFMVKWNAAATYNQGRDPKDMIGEGIVRYDHTLAKGERQDLLPDAIAGYDRRSEGETDGTRLA